MMVSAALDLALALVCVACAHASARSGNDLLFSGYVWIAIAAAVGGIRLGGYTAIQPTHEWLIEVGRGPAALALALGIAAALLGPLPNARWWATVLSIGGAVAVHGLMGSTSLSTATLAMGSTLLVALLAVASRSLVTGRTASALWAVLSLTTFLIVAFGMSRIELPTSIPLERVDIVHVLLMGAYGGLWLSVRQYASR